MVQRCIHTHRQTVAPGCVQRTLPSSIQEERCMQGEPLCMREASWWYHEPWLCRVCADRTDTNWHYCMSQWPYLYIVHISVGRYICLIKLINGTHRVNVLTAADQIVFLRMWQLATTVLLILAHCRFHWWRFMQHGFILFHLEGKSLTKYQNRTLDI